MVFDGAVITEQGLTFAIAIVKSSALQSPDREKFRRSFVQVFGPMPIVLMAQNYQGRATFFGRTDIVKFLANIALERIPWRRFTLN